MHDTREAWLTAAKDSLRDGLFRENGYAVELGVKVSCGFPSRSALARKKRRMAECWSREASSSRNAEIFISPLLADPVEVLGTLVHEIIHDVVGTKAGHKGPFKKCAVKLGLVGKMTSTEIGPDLKVRLHALADSLEAYPHAALNPSLRQKKQGTRMLKFECPGCGWTGRATAKWFEAGLPTCTCGSEMQEA